MGVSLASLEICCLRIKESTDGDIWCQYNFSSTIISSLLPALRDGGNRKGRGTLLVQYFSLCHPRLFFEVRRADYIADHIRFRIDSPSISTRTSPNDTQTRTLKNITRVPSSRQSFERQIPKRRHSATSTEGIPWKLFLPLFRLFLRVIVDVAGTSHHVTCSHCVLLYQGRNRRFPQNWR